MKKLIKLVPVIVLLSTVSCNKSSDGNKGVLVEQSPENNMKKDSLTNEQTDRYVAEDGSSAFVTFKYSVDQNSISISSNKMTIKAPQTEVAGVYEDHDYKIIAKNDSVKITQGNNVILLKKARGN